MPPPSPGLSEHHVPRSHTPTHSPHTSRCQLQQSVPSSGLSVNKELERGRGLFPCGQTAAPSRKEQGGSPCSWDTSVVAGTEPNILSTRLSTGSLPAVLMLRCYHLVIVPEPGLSTALQCPRIMLELPAWVWTLRHNPGPSTI